MEKLFGIPIDRVMWTLITVFLVGVVVLTVIALRNRVIFRMAVRNIPRRRAQTTLIVIGLMLATLLFSASLSIGDTLSYSIRAEVTKQVGMVDEVIRSSKRDMAGRPAFIPYSVYEQVRARLAGDVPIDGLMPVIVVGVPVRSRTTNLSEPEVQMVGIDPELLPGFDQPVDASTGIKLDLASLRDDEFFLSSDAAEELGASRGHALDIYLGSESRVMTVGGIYDVGGNNSSDKSAFLRLAVLQDILGVGQQINRIYLSNEGGLIDGSERTDEVVMELEPLLNDLSLDIDEVKRQGLELADLVGSAFTSIFVLFGSFSMIAGILLIFLIFVMLAAERKRELGIARAVGAQRDHIVRLFTFEGSMYSVLAAAIGSGCGVAVGFLMVAALSNAFDAFGFNVSFAFRWESLVIAYTLGMAATFLVVFLSSGRVSTLNIVRSVRDLPEPPGHQVEIRQHAGELLDIYRRMSTSLKRLHVRRLFTQAMASVGIWIRMVSAMFMAGYLMIVAGAFVVWMGLTAEQLGTFLLGLSFICIGLPLALRHSIGLPERLAYTAAGLLLISLWLLPESVFDRFGLPEFQQGFDLFILSGVMLVVGGVWVVIYNSKYLVAIGVTLLGRGQTLRPMMRIALAYPLSSKFRTGMTLAMFALVIFTIIVMSTIIEAFTASFSDTRRFSGGFDVEASVNPMSPIGDIDARLPAISGLDASNVETIASIGGLAVKLRQFDRTESDSTDAFITSVDRDYASTVTYGFDLRESEFEDDASVWNALVSGTDTVVVSSFVVPSRDGFGFEVRDDAFQLEGFYLQDEELPEVFIEVSNQSGTETLKLRVIGVLDDLAPPFPLVIASAATLKRLQNPPVLGYRFRLYDPQQSLDFARSLEAAFVENGLQAKSLEKEIRDQMNVRMTVNRLIQGFMGLGIIVGVAALGVIAARSVVERRALIGMLRAIGYQRRLVQLTFIFESSFVALLGIALGTVLGLGLSFQIVEEISKDVDGVHFKFPWLIIALVFGVAYGASLLTTFLPANQASKIYPAEALRMGE